MSKTREQLIGEIADLKDREGHGVGIYGTAVCQVCGRAGSFAGWAGAMASHRHGIFVPLAHGHADDAVNRALEIDAPRFCAVCARPVPRRGAAAEPRTGFTCDQCGALPLGPTQIARRRYIDERHGSVAQLHDRLTRGAKAVALTGTAPSSELARARLFVARLCHGVLRGKRRGGLDERMGGHAPQ
jgi:hypothetical protein